MTDTSESSRFSRSKRGATLSLAIVCMIGVAIFSRGRSPKPAPDSNDPSAVETQGASDYDVSEVSSNFDPGLQECLARMFEAAEKKDVSAYLDCFTGEHLQRLGQLADDERSRYKLVDILRAITEGMNGRATSDIQFVGPDQAQLVLERIYSGRVEKQTLHLRRIADEWKIFRLSSPQRIIPEIPYGTPVYAPGPAEGGK